MIMQWPQSIVFLRARGRVFDCVPYGIRMGIAMIDNVNIRG